VKTLKIKQKPLLQSAETKEPEKLPRLKLRTANIHRDLRPSLQLEGVVADEKRNNAIPASSECKPLMDRLLKTLRSTENSSNLGTQSTGALMMSLSR
jgi:hypothetical protein